MILPDLEKNDGMLQVAVYQPDRENFGSWYQRHILSHMTGGEKDIQELRNLTSGSRDTTAPTITIAATARR